MGLAHSYNSNVIMCQLGNNRRVYMPTSDDLNGINDLYQKVEDTNYEEIICRSSDCIRLSQIKTLTSNGNTDHLLAVGDEAYLFLIPESENSYAAVGEYDGSVLLRNGKVILKKSLMDNQAKLSSGHKNSNQMTEAEFVNTMNQLISKKR